MNRQLEWPLPIGAVVETFDPDWRDGAAWMSLCSWHTRSFEGAWFAYHKEHGPIIYYVESLDNQKATSDLDKRANVYIAPKAWELAY